MLVDMINIPCCKKIFTSYGDFHGDLNQEQLNMDIQKKGGLRCNHPQINRRWFSLPGVFVRKDADGRWGERTVLVPVARG